MGPKGGAIRNGRGPKSQIFYMHLATLCFWQALACKSIGCHPHCQCGYTMKANAIGHQPSNFETNSSRRSLIRTFLMNSPEMLSMPRAGVLSASHRRYNKKHVTSHDVYLFTKHEDFMLQRLACGCLKSLFRRCFAARATYTMHP